MQDNRIILECKRIKFYSTHDKDAFFEWIKKIKCIKNFKGYSDKIFLYISDKNIKKEELFDIVALFHRYKINMKQLEVLINSKNRELFLKYKDTYSICICPKNDIDEETFKQNIKKMVDERTSPYLFI